MDKQHRSSSLLLGEEKQTPTTAGFWKMAALPILAGLVVVAFVWLGRSAPGKPEIQQRRDKVAPPAPGLPWPAWQPKTENDRLVEAFRKARNKNPGGGKELLAADPVFDEALPVSEKEADARQAGYFLHRARRILAVRHGEPKPGGGWINDSKRYTLATRAQGSTPALRIKIGNRIEAPSRLVIIDPDIVVEIREGKLYPLRVELHQD